MDAGRSPESVTAFQKDLDALIERDPSLAPKRARKADEGEARQWLFATCPHGLVSAGRSRRRSHRRYGRFQIADSGNSTRAAKPLPCLSRSVTSRHVGMP
jgi:hypothetical protein